MRRASTTVALMTSTLLAAAPASIAGTTRYDGPDRAPTLHVRYVDTAQQGRTNTADAPDRAPGGSCDHRVVGSLRQTPRALPVPAGPQNLRFDLHTTVRPDHVTLTNVEARGATLPSTGRARALATRLVKQGSDWQVRAGARVGTGWDAFLLLDLHWKQPCDGSVTEQSYYFHLTGVDF